MSEPSRHDLFLEISQTLEDYELTDLRTYVGGRKLLPAGRIQHDNAHQIFNKLQNGGKMKPGDLSLLAELMRKIGRADYAEQAERIAANERKDSPDNRQAGTVATAASTSPTDAEIRQQERAEAERAAEEEKRRAEEAKAKRLATEADINKTIRRISYGDSGQVKIAGRMISYDTEDRIYKWKLVRKGRARDVASNITGKSGNCDSRQGAVEHAIEDVFRQLKAQNII